jgi:hypothetical protein
MQTYLSQLIEDLELASQNPVEVPDYKLLNPNHPAIEYGLDYIVAWECAPDVPMPEAFGFPLEAFPPHEQLTEEQAEQLNNAILKLWEANRIIADLPARLPSQLVLYKELRLKWQEQTVRFLPDGNMHLEFCYYVHGECPWGMDFCTCKDEEWYNDSLDMGAETEESELPF